LYEAIDYYSESLNASRQNFLTPKIEQLFAGSTNGMSNNGSASEMGRKSYVGRINYSFDEKYLLELTLRADASAKFPPEKRWGYFPGISMGWRLSQENFMDEFKNIDNIKLRASYGESGNDGVGNFQYLSGYQLGTRYERYPFDYETQQAIVSTGLANPYLTWEKIKITNVGLDFSFWKSKLYGEIDAFYRTRKGIPATRLSTLPSTFGSPLPPENINSLNNRGFELKIGNSDKIKDFFWDINGNISWSRAKWGHYEEPVYEDPDQDRIYRRSGRWTDLVYGYKSDKLFTSQDEIDNLPFDQDQKNNTTLKPGDIKYVDLNKDGILDWRDQTIIGKTTIPQWMFGIEGTINYKNFDASVLFQGAFGYYNLIVLQHKELPPEIMYRLRWTPENNNPNALVPRLGGAATNSLFSDFNFKKAGYVRLKNLVIGYNVPRHLLGKINLSQLRFFISGINLFTFDKLKDYATDPEAPSGHTGYYYPQQKTINFGINLSL
jgi:TonB-linked SusC/RagA family outer membrane protein